MILALHVVDTWQGHQPYTSIQKKPMFLLEGYKCQFSQKTYFYVVLGQRRWPVSWSTTWKHILCINIGSKHGHTFFLWTTLFHTLVFGDLGTSSFIFPHISTWNPHLLQKPKAKLLQTDFGLVSLLDFSSEFAIFQLETLS